MKRLFIAMAAIMLSAGIAKAQVVDTTAQYQQQLQIQQAEAEKAAKEAVKEQERIEKEQAKIERANEKAIKDQQAAEKKARREAREANYGRGFSFSVDPYVGYAAHSRIDHYEDICNIRSGLNLGANIHFDYPLTKRIDFESGIGVRVTNHTFSHNLKYNEATGLLDTVSVTHALYRESSLGESSIIVPIHFAFYHKEGRVGYVGFDFGYSVSNHFANQSIVDGKLNVDYSFNNTKVLNPWRIDFVICTNKSKKFLIFRPGIQLYYNLLPVLVGGANNGVKIHELGIRLAL